MVNVQGDPMPEKQGSTQRLVEMHQKDMEASFKKLVPAKFGTAQV